MESPSQQPQQSSSQLPSSQSTETPPSQPPQEPPPSTNPNPNPNPNADSNNSNPNPNPNPSLNRPPQQFNRQWPQTSPFSHFPSQFHPPASSSSSSPSPSSTPLPSVSAPIPRCGIAIGVPAHHPSPPSPAVSPSFVGAQFAAMPRNPVNVPDPIPASISAPARPPMHGIPSMGMMGSQIRPGGVPPSVLNQQRPVQAGSNNIPPVSQNFQGHGMLRASSVASPSSSAPSTSQSQQSLHQPWLSSVPHARPPLPSQSFRPQVNSQTLQQRSHISTQSPQLTPASSQLQQLSSQQQQQSFATSNQSQQNHAQQLTSSRVPHPSANQQQMTRPQGLGNQKPPSPAMMKPNPAQLSPTSITGSAEAIETCTKILSKRSVQELVNQIDPSEKLDPEVEDILVDIAEDFIDSVTTFGCSLAKHRKSNTLEAKDILVHLERNWDMTLPGFGGDEIKTYKKPVANDAHKERLAVIRKSLAASEAKTSAGTAAGNIKGPLSKATTNIVGS